MLHINNIQKPRDEICESELEEAHQDHLVQGFDTGLLRALEGSQTIILRFTMFQNS